MRTARLNIGILAHVDAGKTTLAESILYQTGTIRKLGRVDHQSAFLDTYAMERERGITIFSKQAEIMLYDRPVTLLDTPGHVDFSAEMERTLQVLDAAILVISGADGIQGHVLTLWRLLKQYEIPVYLFINKMDQPGTEQQKLIRELQSGLDERCIDFTVENDAFLENLAVIDDFLLEQYLETGEVREDARIRLIRERKVFPCYFGSALRMEGVDRLLDGIYRYADQRDYPDTFGARVYKIGRDAQGNRLTYLKVTGGSLKVKQPLHGIWNGPEGQSETWNEKADQIRVYSGAAYETVQIAEAGTVCCVTGLTRTVCGQGLGYEEGVTLPVLEPVLTYGITLPDDADVHSTFLKLRQLEEEIPELHLVWSEQTQEIHVQVMGEVQTEILKNLIRERFQITVSFGSGSIVYKETIEDTVEGVGHYEPLRHYAEVHLLLEPGERGSGMQFASDCSTDLLDLNWQRLILTHLEEKQHRGVLTGAEITDMRITLLTGKAHLKHTEGGDFRQATYRAVRQGLRQAKSILLEPVFEFRLEVPAENVGRAMADIQKMHGTFEGPMQEGDLCILTGTAPVSEMRDYQKEVAAYSRGCGKLFCSLKGYERCHNEEEIVALSTYDPDADTENPCGSVFCSHGAGTLIPWDQVEDHMHLEYVTRVMPKKEEDTEKPYCFSGVPADIQDDEELMAIFQRTYGSIRQERSGWTRSTRSFGTSEYRSPKAGKPQKEACLLVDGYNIIFAWKELKELASVNLEGARGKLMDILCNYQGFRRMHLIVVFDAYKVEGGVGEVFRYHNIHVVYTKEAETADQYIEKTVHQVAGRYEVTVATSDAAEQIIIWGQGARRMSAAELHEEISRTCREIQGEYLKQNPGGKHLLFEDLPADLAEFLEDVRLGKQSFREK